MNAAFREIDAVALPVHNPKNRYNFFPCVEYCKGQKHAREGKGKRKADKAKERNRNRDSKTNNKRKRKSEHHLWKSEVSVPIITLITKKQKKNSLAFDF